ncbi:MAG: Fic family protein [Chloroflexi bacterium]|nr:Fic family protein [Chloroflexota bacterium]
MSRGRKSRAAIHQRLAFEVVELRRFGGLPSPIEAEGIWNEIWYSEAHGSTAIEGNTLVLKEVEALLREGKAIGDKQLKDYLEVQGYAEAARWIYGQAIKADSWDSGMLLTLQEVRHVHYLAMEPVWKVAPHPNAYDTESPGNWRQHNIHPFDSGMTPPDHTQVQALMTRWIDEVCVFRDDPAPIAEAVAKRHAAFERIHPFLDGNGRTGRLLMNLILVRLGYPPAIIHKRDRVRYLRALQKADHADTGPLGELIARAIIDNLMRFILPAVAGPVKLVPLEALATEALSVKALRKAAERGRLRVVRGEAGTLVSSRQWLDIYLASRYRGQRQPQSREQLVRH